MFNIKCVNCGAMHDMFYCPACGYEDAGMKEHIKGIIDKPVETKKLDSEIAVLQAKAEVLDAVVADLDKISSRL